MVVRWALDPKVIGSIPSEAVMLKIEEELLSGDYSNFPQYYMDNWGYALNVLKKNNKYAAIEDIEDALSETFLKIDKARNFNGELNLRSFIVMVATRTLIDIKRKRNRRVPTVSTNDNIVDTNVVKNYRIIDFTKYHLQQGMTDVLNLWFNHNLNSTQISKALNIPPGTVKTRLMRAKQKLGPQILEEFCQER